MTFAIFTNLVVACLCVAVVLQGWRMMRSIQAMKSGDFKDTVAALDNATAQARSVLGELKSVLATDGMASVRTIQSGETLRDELSIMVGIGNAVADRLVEASAAATEDKKSKRVTKAAASAAPAAPAATGTPRARRSPAKSPAKSDAALAGINRGTTARSGLH